MRSLRRLTHLATLAAAASVVVALVVTVAESAPRLSIDTNDASQISELVRLARDAHVIGIGESHDHPAHHEAQARIVEALVNAGVLLALAFEMLTQDQQAAVDAALAENLPAEQLDARLAWTSRGWPDFAMYFPLFELARRHRLPVIAADLEPASVRAVSRRGLGAVSDDGREGLRSRLPVNTDREDALRRELKDAHCGFLPAAAQGTMAEAWHARNVTIARRTLEAVDRSRSVVLITGRGHLAPDAVPGQLAELKPGTRSFVVDLVEEGATALPNADVVWTTTRMVRPDKCEELRKRMPRWREGTNSGVPAASRLHAQTQPSTERTFTTLGTVQRLLPDTRLVLIAHGEIAGLMEAMDSMAFSVDEYPVLRNVKPGDRVRFTLRQSGSTLTLLRVDLAR
jgi:uncharacterized iron-regulated protein/Cu/Ag efflux protein CusF